MLTALCPFFRISTLRKRMNPRRITSVLVFSILIVPVLAIAPLSAQDAGGFSMQQCIETGLKNNIEMRRAESAVQRSGTYRTEAYGQFLPNLRGSASWSRSDEDQVVLRANDLFRSRNSYSYSLQAGLTLFDGMRNFNTVDQSLLEYQATEVGFARTRQYVTFSIQQSFFNVLRLRQLTRVAESNLERSRAQLDRIREMNAVGSVPQADVYRQEVVAAGDELAVIEAHNNYNNALADLQALLGLQPREDFSITDAGLDEDISPEDIAAYRGEIGTHAQLVSEAQRRRADFRQAELSLRGAEKGVSIARAGHWPSLLAFAQYNWNNLELADFTTYDRFVYGLQLSVPIFSNFSVSSAVERGEIYRIDTENELEQLRRAIAIDVTKALNALETAEKNVEISGRKLRSAREDQRIAQERYSLGAGTLLDQVTANANLTLAESDVVNATFNYLTAREHMEYQLGRTQN